MELPLGKQLGILIAVILLVPLICSLYLVPYKSAFMRWYMKTFSTDYRAVKNIFNEMISVQEDYAEMYPDMEDASLHFLSHLHADKRFVSVSDKKREFERAKTLEQFYKQNQQSNDSFETFKCCCKKSKKSHRIKIHFVLKIGIQLHSIELLYIEEKGPDTFAYSIEKKKFPPNNRGGGGKMHSPETGPVLVDSI